MLLLITIILDTGTAGDFTVMSKANPAHPVQSGLSASVCDETLRSFAGYSMKRAFNVVQADLSRALEPFGLRMMTFTALILIVDNPDLSQTALRTGKQRLDPAQSRAERPAQLRAARDAGRRRALP
jgi:hypothetical protein